ncbi:MAG TPA: formate dehydrogenase accessory protein FdhE [Thermoguttaceae bacterium]|nr:formate dehydrogenase accessory protein FdhE [Thermoguttaceae bacterium]
MNDTGTPGGAFDVELVAERLRSLLGRDGISDDYVRLRVGVFEAQAAVLSAFVDSSVSRTSTAIPARRGHAGPAIDPEMVPVDAASARRLFDAIARECSQFGSVGADLSRLRSAVDGEPGLLESLIGRAAFGPDAEYLASVAGRLDVSPELLLLLGRLVAAPLVTCAVRHLLEDGTVPSESDGSCPACGSTPGLGSLRSEDGRRVLHCSLCGHVWPFGRLACPFCASEDEATLTRLTVAGEDARRIEVCDRCRHYLKVIDRRGVPEAEPFIPLVEEMAGLYLDLVAEKEGYLRNLPYAAVG